MTSVLAKEVLETAEQNPKIQILYTHIGKKAFEIAKTMFKADDE